MEQSKQLVSRELAERMRELGFVQTSLFYYNKQGYIVTENCGSSMIGEPQENGSRLCTSDIVPYLSAYTVAELGEMLPTAMTLTRKDVSNNWLYPEAEGNRKTAATEADARAKMLIWLAEQKLINPREIKI